MSKRQRRAPRESRPMGNYRGFIDARSHDLWPMRGVAWVVVHRAPGEAKYSVTCERHDETRREDTERNARIAMSNPSWFCGGCAEDR